MTQRTCVLPTDENSAIEIRPGDIPISDREEEVDQSDVDETAEDHLDDEETNGALNRVKIMPGANDNGTDTESLNNIWLANNEPEDDASTVFLDISEDEYDKDEYDEDNVHRSLEHSRYNYRMIRNSLMSTCQCGCCEPGIVFLCRKCDHRILI